jgi:hypothetical protein
MSSSLCGREYVFFWGHKLKKAIARTEPSTTTSGEPVQQLKGCGRVSYIEGHNLRLLRETPAITRDLTKPTKNTKSKKIK